MHYSRLAPVSIAFLWAVCMPAQAVEPAIEAEWEIERNSVFQYEVTPLVLRITHPEALTLERLRISGLPGPDQVALTPFEEQRPSRREQRNGRVVTISRFRAEALAERAGVLRFEPRLHFSIVEQRAQSYFFTQRIERPASLDVRPFILNVRALPQSGRPAGFQGAVGHFEMDTVLDATLPVTSGALLTLRSTLSGLGPVGRLPAPQPTGVPAASWRWYEAREIPGTPWNTRVFERVIVPLRAGELTFPALTTVFFDPRHEHYVVLTNGPFQIHVALAETPEFEPPVPPQWNGVSQGASAGPVLKEHWQPPVAAGRVRWWFWLAPPVVAIMAALGRAMAFRRSKSTK